MTLTTKAESDERVVLRGIEQWPTYKRQVLLDLEAEALLHTINEDVHPGLQKYLVQAKMPNNHTGILKKPGSSLDIQTLDDNFRAVKIISRQWSNELPLSLHGYLVAHELWAALNTFFHKGTIASEMARTLNAIHKLNPAGLGYQVHIDLFNKYTEHYIGLTDAPLDEVTKTALFLSSLDDHKWVPFQNRIRYALYPVSFEDLLKRYQEYAISWGIPPCIKPSIV